jgi:methylated-DNA-[protein]-cysteine S-methyltransferase
MNDTRMVYSILDGPDGIGDVLLITDGEVLTGLYLDLHRGGPFVQSHWFRDDAKLREPRAQLSAYFAGELASFKLPIAFRKGTSFQKRVWEALCPIPLGTTITYGELARRVGAEGSARAVGAAVGRNPISIIVPCHRIIGSNGSLTGYGGGLERKRWLLDHEDAMSSRMADTASKRPRQKALW